MVQPVPRLEAIIFTEEIETDGHSPLCVIGNDYLPYITKSVRNQPPDYYIINEFICTGLLNCWNIPTPSISAIKVKPAMLPTEIVIKKKSNYLNVVSFGSHRILEAIELQRFMGSSKSALRKVMNSSDLFKIALFDIWVENDDRKPTNNNLLLVPIEKKLQIQAIDHAFTFCSMAYQNLTFDDVCSTWNDGILCSDFGQLLLANTSITQAWNQNMKDYFYESIDFAKQYFEQIVSNVPDELNFSKDLQDQLYAFLFNDERNKNVLNEFYSRII